MESVAYIQRILNDTSFYITVSDSLFNLAPRKKTPLEPDRKILSIPFYRERNAGLYYLSLLSKVSYSDDAAP